MSYAQEKGIDVRNTPEASTNAVAELVLALMLGLARSVVRADTAMKNGTWAKKQITGTELAGKTLGVVGYGRIGQHLGEKAKALGMTVVACDPYVEHEDIVPMETVLSTSDYISIHVPHTDETHNLHRGGSAREVKDGTYLIDASRGGTVDEAALLAAIVAGKLAGVALDVYTEEPPTGAELRVKLVEHPRVIATPHIGAGTVEAKARIGDEWSNSPRRPRAFGLEQINDGGTMANIHRFEDCDTIPDAFATCQGGHRTLRPDR